MGFPDRCSVQQGSYGKQPQADGRHHVREDAMDRGGIDHPFARLKGYSFYPRFICAIPFGRRGLRAAA